MKKFLSLFLSSIIALSAVLCFGVTSFAADAYQNNDLKRVSVHDPSVVKGDDGKYYVFGSHIAYASSDDLQNWNGGSSTMDGDGTHSLLSVDGKSWKENCAKALEWTTTFQKTAMNRSDEDLEFGCWALDVIYNKTMKKWCMYACSSVWGTPASVIFLAVSDSIDGEYKFVDTMIYSGFSSYNKLTKNKDAVIDDYNYTNTNVTKALGCVYVNKYIKNSREGWFWTNYTYDCGWGKSPNAIDPAAFYDKDGNMWLSYGSFSGGIYVVPVDEATGLVDYKYMKNHEKDGYDRYFGKQISCTNGETEGSGEGTFIVYDDVSDYYYFYLTYGGLAGADGYNIREYRSKNPDGPYEDKAGNLATDFKNTGTKLIGNYQFSCQSTAYLSGGHSSSFIDDDGKMYQVYHTRFACDEGWGHQVRVHQMLRTSDGWAVMLPFEYQGETVSENGYSKEAICGIYQFINNGNTIQNRKDETLPLSSIVNPTVQIELKENGDICCLEEHANGKAVGSWSITDGTYYAEFVIGCVKYSGVFCEQKDESADGKTVMTFAALGDNNESVWGVKCDDRLDAYGSAKTVIISGELNKDGAVREVCAACGEILGLTEIPAIATLELSDTEYAYDGEAKTPVVIIKDKYGNDIGEEYYSVYYPDGRTEAGEYTVTVVLSDDYSGTYYLDFGITSDNAEEENVSLLKKIIDFFKKIISKLEDIFRVPEGTTTL